MPRYVTPRGVEVETSDEAARMVGYKPVEKSEPAKKSATKKASSSKSEK